MNVRKWNYGKYSNGNYGSHTQAIQIGNLTLYFSYDTVIAFESKLYSLTVCENVWGITTGKHLNWIQPNKNARHPYTVFQGMLENVLKQHGLIVENKNGN